MAREIEETAIKLFAERGYENVTVADIADAMNASRRTFFRYFASKDQVLQAHMVRLQTRVIRALERRPSAEPAAEALRNAFLDTADVGQDERESMLLRNRVLREYQGQAGWMMMSPEIAGKLTELVAARMKVDADADLLPRLVVATTWAAVDAATAHWVTTTDDESLINALRSAFDHVLTGSTASKI